MSFFNPQKKGEISAHGITVAWVYTLAVFNCKPLLPNLCFLVPFLFQAVFSHIDLFWSIKISQFVFRVQDLPVRLPKVLRYQVFSQTNCFLMNKKSSCASSVDIIYGFSKFPVLLQLCIWIISANFGSCVTALETKLPQKKGDKKVD